MNIKDPDVRHFVSLVEGWNARGWGEYLLWETLEGTRDRPFRLLDPLTQEDLAVLHRLRDKLKIWPFWDPVDEDWVVGSVEYWRAHAREITADDARERIGEMTA